MYILEDEGVFVNKQNPNTIAYLICIFTYVMRRWLQGWIKLHGVALEITIIALNNFAASN